jgi:hypothetical protein
MNFMVGEVTGNRIPLDRGTKEAVARSLNAKWRQIPVKAQASIAALPHVWASLRREWPTATESERHRAREQWAKVIPLSNAQSLPPEISQAINDLNATFAESRRRRLTPLEWNAAASRIHAMLAAAIKHGIPMSPQVASGWQAAALQCQRNAAGAPTPAQIPVNDETFPFLMHMEMSRHVVILNGIEAMSVNPSRYRWELREQPRR